MTKRIAYILGDFSQKNYINKMASERITWLAGNYDCQINVIVTQHMERKQFPFPLPENITFTIIAPPIPKIPRPRPDFEPPAEPKYKLDPPPLKSYIKEQFILNENLKVAMDEWKPDVVISNIEQGKPILSYPEAHVLNIAHILMDKINIGIYEHPKLFRFFNQIVTNWQHKEIIQQLTQDFDLWITQSLNEEKNWRKTLPKVKFIPNPIPEYSEYPWGEKSKYKYVIVLGDFSRWGGFDRMLKFWKGKSRYLANWKMKLCGNGDPEWIKDIIRENKFRRTVFCKPLPWNIKSIASIDSIVVSISQRGEVASFFAEAFSVGLPCLMVTYPYVRSEVFWNNHTGFTVPRVMESNFIARLTTLMNDYTFRYKMKKFCRKKRLKGRRIEEVMGQWINLFETEKPGIKPQKKTFFRRICLYYKDKKSNTAII